MRRLWAAIIVIALLLALCFIGAAAVTARADGLLVMLRQVRDAVAHGNDGEAVRCAERAESFWRENAVLLGSLLRHDEADGVTVQLAEIRAYALARDRDELLAVCAATESRLEHIREMEFPLLQNVL